MPNEHQIRTNRRPKSESKDKEEEPSKGSQEGNPEDNPHEASGTKNILELWTVSKKVGRCCVVLLVELISWCLRLLSKPTSLGFCQAIRVWFININLAIPQFFVWKSCLCTWPWFSEEVCVLPCFIWARAHLRDHSGLLIFVRFSTMLQIGRRSDAAPRSICQYNPDRLIMCAVKGQNFLFLRALWSCMTFLFHAFEDFFPDLPDFHKPNFLPAEKTFHGLLIEILEQKGLWLEKMGSNRWRFM